MLRRVIRQLEGMLEVAMLHCIVDGLCSIFAIAERSVPACVSRGFHDLDEAVLGKQLRAGLRGTTQHRPRSGPTLSSLGSVFLEGRLPHAHRSRSRSLKFRILGLGCIPPLPSYATSRSGVSLSQDHLFERLLAAVSLAQKPSTRGCGSGS